ncbi:unnamed protein product [Anisakis simplex]|uniref:Alpha/beta-hydrolase n=1 Tax=Anisakis simplex TaxID=6269 RepID=A0A0M3JHJ7_ANISI|nr:unnamed protein product [Anisakis simplex]
MYFHGIYGVDQWDELIKCCPNYGPKGSEPPLVCNYAKYIQSNHHGGVTAVNFTNGFDTKCSHLVAKLSEDKVWDSM